MSHPSRGPATLVPIEDDTVNGAPSFIPKLGQILQDSDATSFVSWSPSGESVVVIDSASFAQQKPHSLLVPLCGPEAPYTTVAYQQPTSNQATESS
ncbi:hypothetical protein T484DRAFT_1782170 [Baffinella frigidus]|nr:hypothetical protein T484DRAFT_1782170 [Cryptophyta sp. CCMP2293]